MDVEKLRKNHTKLIRYLKEHDYSKSYVDSFRSALSYIFKNNDKEDWKCYEDVCSYFAEFCSPHRYRQYRSILIGIRDFDLYDKYPGGRRSSLRLDSKVTPLSDEFAQIIEYYKSSEFDRGMLQNDTVEGYAGIAKAFFTSLQAKGITNISDITEKAILSVFLTDGGKIIKREDFANSVKRVLRRCSEAFQTKAITALIPVAKNHHKNIQHLTPEETQKIRNVLTSPDSPLPLRDRAIGVLAYYTGMRGGDIAALNLDSIDLENDKIHIIQNKTGEPLDLPLKAVVGNAIYDYVTLERPKSDNPSLFLTKQHQRLSGGGMYPLSCRIMKAAGVRQGKNQRKGLHIFRHHLATTLLGNGIPQPVISSTLGQVDPLSVETYLSSDFVNLKSCALSIDMFPVAKEVLS